MEACHPRLLLVSSLFRVGRSTVGTVVMEMCAHVQKILMVQVIKRGNVQEINDSFVLRVPELCLGNRWDLYLLFAPCTRP